MPQISVCGCTRPIRALLAVVFTVAMDVSGLPPFAQRTHKGWGTQSCVNTQLENAVKPVRVKESPLPGRVKLFVMGIGLLQHDLVQRILHNARCPCRFQPRNYVARGAFIDDGVYSDPL